MQQLGFTRSSRQPDHFLLTPDTFIRAPFPGMTNATAIVHAAPASGARFTEYTAEISAGGTLGPTKAQRFIYVLEGEVNALADDRAYSLQSAGYAFFPAGVASHVKTNAGARLARQL